ncbi:crossover junction endodeoxyribonuclease RuvC [Candidatus Sumerlaeota bacterium]|nr:crossover junction endodeoxyribonuclease RuvC [Candidatus Sumerlaeota bacterium]
MRILGIDPGLANTGWGMVEHEAQSIRELDSGIVVTDAGVSLAERLQAIYDGVHQAVLRWQPGAVAVESLFFAKNTKTAMSVAQARGVAILAATKEGAEFHEYTPLQIKQAVAGRGRATKEQVIKMVRVIANVREESLADHTADALAAAICHCNFAKFESRRKIFGR